MDLILPRDFYQATTTKFLLVDTSVLIDTSINPKEFVQLINRLKENGCTLVTIDAVLIEFIKGVVDKENFNKKKSIITDIVDLIVPIEKDIWETSLKLLDLYKEDGKTASVTDLLLAGVLSKYKDTTLLITKNLNDFPTNIFTLVTYFNLFHRKSIHNYGVLTFQKVGF